MLAVNGVEVQGKSAFEVSSLLQGPNETLVTIQVVNCDSTVLAYALLIVCICQC